MEDKKKDLPGEEKPKFERPVYGKEPPKPFSADSDSSNFAPPQYTPPQYTQEGTPPANSPLPPEYSAPKYYPPQSNYPPPQGGYPPPQGGYPPHQGGYQVPPQGGYPPPQGDNTPPPPGYQQPQYGQYHPHGQYYGSPYGGYDPYRDRSPIGMSVTSMVFGIICLLALCSPVFGLICGIVAIVLASVHTGKYGSNGFAKAGLICGIIGAGISFILLVSIGANILEFFTDLDDEGFTAMLPMLYRFLGL